MDFELRISFLSGWIKKIGTFHDMWELCEIKVMFCWNIIMLIHLGIVYATFHAIVAEVSTCDWVPGNRKHIKLQKSKYKDTQDLLIANNKHRRSFLSAIFLNKDNYFMEKEKLNWCLQAWLDGKAVVLNHLGNCRGNLLNGKFLVPRMQKLLVSGS